jgi:hypothetical protein
LLVAVSFFRITMRAQEPTLAGAEKIDYWLEGRITANTSVQLGTVTEIVKKM